MAGKTNGTQKGNGKAPKDDGVVKFPTLAERDRIRREKMEEEKKQKDAYRKEYKQSRRVSNPPFFNTGNIPPITGFLVISFLIVQIPLYLVLTPTARFDVFYTLGFVPGRFTGVEDFTWFTLFTPITHVFIHGSWMHLAFNSVMTLALGSFFEKQYGMERMIIFVTACAFMGVLFQFIFSPFSTIPVIGASGAISGLFGVTLLRMFETGQMGHIAKLSKYGIWPMLFFWGFLIAGLGLLSGSDVAWEAHLGGYIGGLALHFAERKGIIKLPH